MGGGLHFVVIVWFSFNFLSVIQKTPPYTSRAGGEQETSKGRMRLQGRRKAIPISFLSALPRHVFLVSMAGLHLFMFLRNPPRLFASSELQFAPWVFCGRVKCRLGVRIVVLGRSQSNQSGGLHRYSVLTSLDFLSLLLSPSFLLHHSIRSSSLPTRGSELRHEKRRSEKKKEVLPHRVAPLVEPTGRACGRGRSSMA